MTKDYLVGSTDRFSLWKNYLRKCGSRKLAEIGVYRGEFAAKMLTGNLCIEEYFLIDPWRQLGDWNKPANTDDIEFSRIYEEAIENTNFAAEQRRILRGKTSEVIHLIEDEYLDFIYIDGDHTLRGITVDLIMSWPKVKAGGSIGGDDLTASIWQHEFKYEPSFVFPFAVYFAEATNCPIYLLPYNQFNIIKDSTGFKVHDLTGTYKRFDLKAQIENAKKKRKRNFISRFFCTPKNKKIID